MTPDSRTPSTPLDDAAILRYLSGRCEPAEMARIARWLAADPARQAEMAALRAAWARPPIEEVDPDDRMWHWIAARMHEPVAPPAVPTLIPPRRSRSYGRAIGVAAAVLTAVVGATLIFRPFGRASALHGNSVAASSATSGVQVLVAPRGTRVTSNLPDGSRVILAPESRLTFAVAATGAREVYLQSGEAFFSVTHDPARPFRVHTPHGVVEDIGTEFVVTARPETGGTRAVVIAGVVALRRESSRQHGVTLRAGELGNINTRGIVSVRHHVDVAAYVGWTHGELVFDDVPVDDALTTLSRWYDLRIRTVDTALARRRFTATFHDEPLAQVLGVLQVALDADAERTDSVVVLRPHRFANSSNR